jgi:hypothetical protein
MAQRVSYNQLDDGIRDAVRTLHKAGFKTFTSCEGGRGHAFRHPTIGVELDGEFIALRDRLAEVLQLHGCQSFEISLMCCYHPSEASPTSIVYVEGIDLLSDVKRRRVLDSIRRKERRLQRELEALLRDGD